MAELQQEIRFCRSRDGVRIAYAKVGEGPPLVKAANWMSHLEYDLSSPIWRHWIVELSRQNTLWRYDQRGCGLSDWDVTDISFEAWVRDLEAVVNACEVEPVPLLGMLQGGAVAIAYAVRHPERVSHLILCGSYLRGRLKRNPSPEQIDEAETMLKLAELGWGKDDFAFRQFFTTQFIPGGSSEQWRWFNDLQRVSTSPANAVRLMRALYTVDVSELAREVRCPTLVLHSKNDRRVPFEEGRLVASAIPGAQFVPLDARNHILLESEPAWRRFLRETSSFLEMPQVTSTPASPDIGFADLTGREREVLHLLAAGLANAEIAGRLAVREKTVRNHITSIFSKMSVPNRAQAIVRARDAGFGVT